MEIINALCPTNIDNLISDGVGGAATAYCKVKERIYHDLDRTKYELLPFIMETTGALSKSAFGFCKQLKKRRDDLNCQSTFDSHHTNDRKPLLSALSIELQRANSRMILERTPVLDDLIDSAMMKCAISISKKKEEAIETLRLQKVETSESSRADKLREEESGLN